MSDSGGHPTAKRFTAPDTVELATPQAIMDGFRLLGFDWEPVPFDESALTTEPGLYRWVDGQAAGQFVGATPPELRTNFLDRGVLYCGIGWGKAGGARSRLNYEVAW
jgi:hypothetical protein